MRNKNKNIMLDLEKITLNVREIALRAGAFLRNERSGFDRSKVEKKNAHDYVSSVDCLLYTSLYLIIWLGSIISNVFSLVE